MKMKLAILLTLIFLATLNGLGQTNIVELKRVAPSGPACAVNARGNVLVEIEIDRGGNVVTTNAISGHPLLKVSTVVAARQWKFNLDDTSEKRRAVLSFDFLNPRYEFVSESAGPYKTTHEVTFPKPLSVRIEPITFVPLLWTLPRKDGQIEPVSCSVHYAEMQVETIDFICNDEKIGSASILLSEEYDEAFDELFPNAASSDKNGCNRDGIERKEIHYCQSCRIARNNWLQIYSN